MLRPVAVSTLMFAFAGCQSGGTSPRHDAVTAGIPGTDTPAVEIELHPYFRWLRMVEGVVGDRTLTLLLDTGGGSTLVTPSVASGLGCRPYGRDVGHRMSGEPVEFQRCDALDLAIGGWHRSFAPVAVFDVNALLPPELPRLDGVLALDAFRGRVITIDWSRSRLVVHSSLTANAAIRSSGVPLRAATGMAGNGLSVFLPASGTRGPVWLLLDSGNIRGTLVAEHILRDSLLATDVPATVALSIGTRPPVRMPFEPVDLVIDGALGTDFLDGGPVTLDLRDSR